MEGIISGIKRMEIHDGDGIRTTVFFKGCSMKCIWCHNPESIGYEPEIAWFRAKCIGCGNCAGVCPEGAISMADGVPSIDRTKCVRCMACADHCPVGAIEGFGRPMSLDELEKLLLQDELFYRNSGGGVTFSGGECLMQPEFVTEMAKRLHEKGISVDVDTAGHVKKEILEGILPYVDTFLYDVKAIDPAVHERCTGSDNRLILENLKFLSDAGAKIEIRYPLIKGYNDGECGAIGAFLSGLSGVKGIKVLKYHRFAGSRYEALGMENTLPDTVTTDEDMEKARQTLKACGVAVIED